MCVGIQLYFIAIFLYIYMFYTVDILKCCISRILETWCNRYLPLFLEYVWIYVLNQNTQWLSLFWSFSVFIIINYKNDALNILWSQVCLCTELILYNRVLEEEFQDRILCFPSFLCTLPWSFKKIRFIRNRMYFFSWILVYWG